MRCDKLTPLQGSKTGYQKRGNRCEGVYVINIGAPSLVPKSFTLGPIRYDLNATPVLEISAPGQTEPVNIRATAIPLKTYYRLDAVLPARSVLSWPLADVLVPEGLSSSRVGVLGLKGTDKDGVLVPVRVAPKGAATTSSKPLLIIQASFDAQLVKWRWGPLHDQRCAALGQWQDAISYPVTAGWPITIDLSKLPGGTHCFEAMAQSGVSNDWSPLKLRIDIPAQ